MFFYVNFYKYACAYTCGKLGELNTSILSVYSQDTTAVGQTEITERMQSRLLDLQEQVRALEREKEESEEQHLVTMRKLREEIRDVADKSRAEVVAMEMQHKVGGGWVELLVAVVCVCVCV